MNPAAVPVPLARAARPPTGEVDPAVLDPRVLASLCQLDPGHDKQFMARVLLTYRDSLSRQLDQVKQARARHDLVTVQLAAHTLKSASASIGARGLAQLCGTVESCARQGDGDGLAVPLAQLAEEAERVDVAVLQILSALTP